MFRLVFIFLVFAFTISAWSQQKSVDITASEVTPVVFSPGTTDEIVRFVFTNIVGQAKISNITITRTGTATDIDVPTAGLYLDTNQDGVRDGSAIATATFSGGAATFPSLTNQSLSTTIDWLIAYDIASAANQSANAGCSINENDIVGSGGTMINLTNGTSYTTGDVALPVTLSSFGATAERNQIILEWATESEVNNLGFEILRSTQNPDNFVTISSYQYNPGLQGQGNTNNRTEYSFTDNSIDENLTYWYKLVNVDLNGNRTEHGPISANINSNTIAGFALHQNYPNPFNPNTTISFEIPNLDKNKLRVVLSVFNNLGQEVATVFDGTVNSGTYTFNWDGKDNFNRKLPSGVYTYSLRSENFVSSRKMVLLK
jgi:hypothetical protein